MSYDDAVAALYRAPHGEFVAERKRLAGELKAAGDKDAAARLAKRPRPPLSAWAINQLWWDARGDFDALFAAAARLRHGDRAATEDHRGALAALRARAGEILVRDGHGAAEATLRRIATTLSALAAAGEFAPDTPGALTADRDPPGFEAMALAVDAVAPPPAPAAAATPAPAPERARTDDDAAAAARAEKARRDAEQAERARREAERARVRDKLAAATVAVEAARRDADARRRDLAAAEERLRRAEAEVSDAEAELARLSRGS